MLDTIKLLLQVLGALGIFIFGMKLMSESILKISGEKLRSVMSSMTTNRFAGILTGFLITCLVQSSSATTVMVVSFVHAQLLNLTQAIGVIMGANLGTTITAWIVSIFGFKFKITAIAIPIIGIGVALSFMKKGKTRNFGNFLTGFGLLFLGLGELKDAVPDIKGNQEVLEWIASFSNYGFASILIFAALGSLLTVVVQSSSAAMAITLTMANMGWLNFEQSAAIILGENIGTKITAWLAALPANTATKRAARAHFMFNVIGVAWMLVLITPFSSFVRWIYEVSTSILPWERLGDDRTDLTNQLALFHSMFNFTNILVLVGFVPLIAKLVTWMIKEKEKPGIRHYRYLKTYQLGTGELNFAEASRAITRLGEISKIMFDDFLEIYRNPTQDMTAKVKELKALEDEANVTTEEVTEYLVNCASDTVSEETRVRANSYLRVAAELEEICDCCSRICNRAVRRYRKNRLANKSAEELLVQFGNKVDRFIDLYRSKLDGKVSAADMEITVDLEHAINDKRRELHKRAVARMQDSGENIKPELLYIDIINAFERIANHSRNIMQSLPKGLK